MNFGSNGFVKLFMESFSQREAGIAFDITLIPKNLAPDVWSWTEFLRAAIGPVIAAVFVVVGIALKESFDRKRAAQLWYEEYYITDGVDRVLSYLMTVEMACSALHSSPNLAALIEHTDEERNSTTTGDG